MMPISSLIQLVGFKTIGSYMCRCCVSLSKAQEHINVVLFPFQGESIYKLRERVRAKVDMQDKEFEKVCCVIQWLYMSE